MNWDKPFTYAEFWKDIEALDVCTHHGFNDWCKMEEVFRYCEGNGTYEKYLSYCKLADSPLLRALS